MMLARPGGISGATAKVQAREGMSLRTRIVAVEVTAKDGGDEKGHRWKEAGDRGIFQKPLSTWGFLGFNLPC